MDAQENPQKGDNCHKNAERQQKEIFKKALGAQNMYFLKRMFHRPCPLSIYTIDESRGERIVTSYEARFELFIVNRNHASVQ
jgi:hypothetical protein